MSDDHSPAAEPARAPEASPAAGVVPLRERSGKFLPGRSGNPQGRRPGHAIVRELLEPRREELIEKAISMALDGSVKALQVCIDRLAPPARPEPLLVKVPALKNASTLDEKAMAIVAAVGDGDLDVESAATLLRALSDATRIAEYDTLSRRLDALEGKLAP